ncbi:MAG: hydantoinase/oxoprolinase family protein [Alphaproteobacteria bacterium]
MGCRLGIDVGGTFTDLLMLDDRSGEVRLLKTPNTPDDPAAGAIAGVRQLLAEAGIEPSQIEQVRCATTVPRRLIAERAGAQVGLLVTEGFEQVLHMARGRTPAPVGGWVGMRLPRPLVDLANTRGVPERINAQGEIVAALDEAVAERAIRELVAAGVDAIAVCLMHAYANRAHERRLGALIAEIAPGVDAVLSADHLRERQEYERTVLTVMNAMLGERLGKHLDDLQSRLREIQVGAPIAVARSDGGAMKLGEAAAHGAHMLRAGPAGGAMAAAFIANRAGQRDAISLDMGGGAADLAAIRDGAPALAGSARIDGLTVTGATIDIHNAGIGGGAVARVGGGGVLRVGPTHAKPACFGGGDDATLTDANVVLGRLPTRLGKLTLESRASEDAVGQVARRLDMDLYQAAEAIIALAEESIAGAARLLAARRGLDGDRAALVAFGGAGPLHGNAVAAINGMYPLIVPPLPGVMSALGFVTAPAREDVMQSLLRPLDTAHGDEIAGLLDKLADLVRERLGDAADAEIGCLAMIRYQRGDNVLTLPVDPATMDVADLAQRFVAEHERRHGFALDRAIELTGLRAFGTAGGLAPERARTGRGGDTSTALTGQQRLYAGGEFVSANVYDRDKLGAGARIAGPALVTQSDATTLVLPGHVAEVDGHGALLIQPAA